MDITSSMTSLATSLTTSTSAAARAQRPGASTETSGIEFYAAFRCFWQCFLAWEKGAPFAKTLAISRTPGLIQNATEHWTQQHAAPRSLWAAPTTLALRSSCLVASRPARGNLRTFEASTYCHLKDMSE